MVEILLVTKEGCLPCRRVKRILEEIRQVLPGLSMEEVDFASERGTILAVEHQILYPPAVFVDGRLVGQGKIREEELKGAIRSRAAAGMG